MQTEVVQAVVLVDVGDPVEQGPSIEQGAGTGPAGHDHHVGARSPRRGCGRPSTASIPLSVRTGPARSAQKTTSAPGSRCRTS